MFVFTTYFKPIIDDERYQRGIDTIRAIYPELVILRKPCEEAVYIENYQAKSDVTRIKEMSLHEEALYFDADVMLNKALQIDDKSKPAFHACWGDPDICVMYHKGHQQFFSELFADFMKLNFWKPLVVQNLLRGKYAKRIQHYCGWKDRGEYEHLVLSAKKQTGAHQKSLILFIPLASGQYIPNNVQKSIGMQNINIDVVPCVSEGVYSSKTSNREETKKKTECQITSRNMAVEWLNRHGGNPPYVAMQDSDIEHLSNDNFCRCLEFLENNPDYVGVAMPHRSNLGGGHIKMAAFVIRTDVLKNFKFRMGDDYHLCTPLKEDLQKIGKWGYLPSEKSMVSEKQNVNYPLLERNPA